jgi:hypothetical protein
VTGVFELAALAASVLAGWAVARAIPGRLHALETFAWSVAIGLLTHAAVEAAATLAGIPPRAPAFLAVDAVVAAASLAIRRPSRRVLSPGRAADSLAILLGIAALAGLALFLVQAVATVPDATDYLAIWGLKGRTIALSGSIPGRLFHDPAVRWSNPEYPLLVPLSLAAMARFAGGWSETGAALLTGACQAATLAALFGFGARRGSLRRGALAAALAAWCVGLYSRGNLGTAEVPMAFGFVLVSEAFLDALAGEPGSGARLAIAAIFGASAKKEGAMLPLFLAALLLLAFRRRGKTAARLAACAALPVAAHAVLLRIARGPVVSRTFDLGLLARARWSELPPRAAETAAEIFRVAVVPALPALIGIAAIFAATRAGDADALLPALAAQLSVYAAACVLSSYGPRWQVVTAFPRITLALFPALALVLTGRAITQNRAGPTA